MTGQPQLITPVDPAVTSLGIDAYALEVRQVPPMPSEVIDPANPWTATLKFRVGGIGSGMVLVAPGAVANVQFYYEGHGAAPEGTLNPTPIEVALNTSTLDATSKSYEYTATVNVPAGRLSTGLYTLTASVDVNIPGGGLRMLAFCEGPLIQAY
jgi:hypothetical protein